MKGRDENGRPTEGIDEVPIKPKKEKQNEECLSKLVDLLQQADRREKKLKESLDFLHRRYHSLYQEHLAYKVERPVHGLSNETKGRRERWMLRSV